MVATKSNTTLRFFYTGTPIWRSSPSGIFWPRQFGLVYAGIWLLNQNFEGLSCWYIFGAGELSTSRLKQPGHKVKQSSLDSLEQGSLDSL